MLSRLYIRNYAIIREVDISFTKGLNIITGETGAGKSILMGALNLVLGERADRAVIPDEKLKCIVEASFQLTASDVLTSLFEKEDWEWQDETVIRRELQANGKSRSFINDTPVSLAQLKIVGNHLVDLHQQFDTADIAATEFQTEVINAMADCMQESAQLRKLYRELSALKAELLEKEKKYQEALLQRDYQQFLFEELTALSLRENELEELEKERNMLTHADHIRLTLQQVTDMLSANEVPVIQQLKTILSKLDSVQTYSTGIQQQITRVQSAYEELKDITSELSAEADGIQSDAGRVIEIDDKLNVGYKLQKKHQVQDTAGLLKIQNELENLLQQFEMSNEELEELKKHVSVCEKACLDLALIISKKRKAIIPSLEQSVNVLLKKLGMPNAVICVTIDEQVLGVYGIDHIQMLFDANKSGKFESIAKVASGGELSRLMLAVKSLVAGKMALPTLIFDEIDTGISGEAAKQVGLLMQSLANAHQIMAITHQPQIAAKANSHYFIYKQEQEGIIQTAVRKLKDEERVEVIAQMMSGEKPTTTALENAREMVTGKE